MNPYWGVGFFQFFAVFFERLFSGQMTALASDEIQMGVLCLTAISASLVGSLLYLRRMTMLANALSHTTLLGIVCAFLLALTFSPIKELTLANLDLKFLLIAALITALLTSFCTEWLVKVMRLYTDASIGLVFSLFFALGITLVTLLTRNVHLGVEAIMGNVDALHLHDLKLIFWITLINAVLFLVFYKEWHLTTFDASFAKVLGFSPGLMSYLLMVLTSLTAIGGFRAVGVFLSLGLMLFPSLIARLFCQRLKTLIPTACLIGCVASILSVALSRTALSLFNLPLSTSGILSVLLSLTYISCIALKSLPLTSKMPLKLSEKA